MYSPFSSTAPRPILSWLLIAILTGLAACSTPEPIKIGFVGTLSGRRSEVGVAARNAVQLRVDQINKAGGIKGHSLKLVIKDSKGSSENCGKIISQMIDNDTRFIIGPMLSKMAEATLKSIEGKDALVVSPTMSTDYLTGKDDNLVRTASTTTIQAKTLADHVHTLGLKKISVVYDLSNRQYTEPLYTAFKDRAGEYGITVPLVLTIHRDKAPEMLPLAKQLSKTDSDAVLLCLSAIDAANLSQQIRKTGFHVQLLGVSWAQTEDLIQHGGKAVEGMQLVSMHQYGTPSAALITFTEQYYTRHNKLPSFVSIRGYDAIGLLAQGMRDADTLEPSQVKKAILDIKAYPGLSDSLKLDSYGDSISGYSIVQVREGTYELVERP